MEPPFPRGLHWMDGNKIQKNKQIAMIAIMEGGGAQTSLGRLLRRRRKMRKTRIAAKKNKSRKKVSLAQISVGCSLENGLT